MLPFANNFLTASDMPIPPVMNLNYNMAPGQAPYIPVPSSFDPCYRLCTAYSADRLGNGYDLCDDPRLSVCNSASQICDHIFWSTDTDGRMGLVYEVDESQVRDLIPVVCRDATELVSNRGRWERRNHTNEVLISSALVLYVQLLPPEPWTMLLGEIPLMHQSRDDPTPIDQLVAEFRYAFHYTSARAFMSRPPIRQYALPSIHMLSVARPISRGYPDVLSMLQAILHLIHNSSFPVYNLPAPTDSDTALEQRIIAIDRNSDHPTENPWLLTSATRIVNFSSPGNMSWYSRIRIGSDSYALTALVQRNANGGHFTTTYALHGSWYRVMGSAVVQVDSTTIIDSVMDNVVTAFYTRRST